MKLLRPMRAARYAGLLALFAGLSFSGLSGCGSIALPPIPLSITIVMDLQIPAADASSGAVDVPLTLFCDLFSEERLNELLTAAGGAEIAALVDIPSVEMESVEFVATQGTFADFTTADLTMTLIAPGTDPVDLGTLTDPNGLGTMFEVVQNPPFDLLNDLSDDECGVPTLHLEGAAPTADIEFTVIANVVVYSQLNLDQQ